MVPGEIVSRSIPRGTPASELLQAIPLRIRKRGQPAPGSRVASPAEAPPATKTEPQVQFREREDGSYDVSLLCSCGQRHVIRLETLDSAR
jgi:hypothetical protein